MRVCVPSLKEVEKEGRSNSHHAKTKIFNSALQLKSAPVGGGEGQGSLLSGDAVRGDLLTVTRPELTGHLLSLLAEDFS